MKKLYIGRRLGDIKFFLRRNTKGRLQRAMRGWSDEDGWNMFSHLEGMMASYLPWMADTAHTWPGCDPENNHHHDYNGNHVCFTFESWQEELRRVGRLYQKLADDDFSMGWEEEHRIREETLAWLGKWWMDLWD